MHHEIYTARSAAILPAPLSTAPVPPATGFQRRGSDGAPTSTIWQCTAINQSISSCPPRLRVPTIKQQLLRDGNLPNLPNTGDREVGLLAPSPAKGRQSSRLSSYLSSCQVNSNLCTRGEHWPLPTDRRPRRLLSQHTSGMPACAEVVGTSRPRDCSSCYEIERGWSLRRLRHWAATRATSQVR